jgi:hypothetical protein
MRSSRTRGGDRGVQQDEGSRRRHGEVVSAKTLDAGASGNDLCVMQLIVQADGLSPTTVAYHDSR